MLYILLVRNFWMFLLCGSFLHGDLKKKNRLRSLVILIIFINLHKYVTELGSLMIQNFLRRGGNVHYKITKCG